MPQGFHEEKNVRTGVAEKHSKNATKGKQEVISDAEIVPAKFKGLKLENGRYHARADALHDGAPTAVKSTTSTWKAS